MSHSFIGYIAVGFGCSYPCPKCHRNCFGLLVSNGGGRYSVLSCTKISKGSFAKLSQISSENLSIIHLLNWRISKCKISVTRIIPTLRRLALSNSGSLYHVLVGRHNMFMVPGIAMPEPTWRIRTSVGYSKNLEITCSASHLFPPRPPVGADEIGRL